MQTESSTEAELVGINYVVGQFLWTHHFLAEQGVFVPTTTIYQDTKVQFYYRKMDGHPATRGHTTSKSDTSL